LNSYSDDLSGNSFNMDTLIYNSDGKRDNNSNSIQLSFQYLTYATPNSHTSIYFGIGPLTGINWAKDNVTHENVYVNGALSQSNDNLSSNGYSLGLLGSAGIEWFFSDHISLHAEYSLSASYTWVTEEFKSSYRNKYYSSPVIYSYEENTKRSSTYWSLSGQSVLFGLSVNF
jgi:hypothetical protein